MFLALSLEIHSFQACLLVICFWNVNKNKKQQQQKILDAGLELHGYFWFSAMTQKPNI